MEHELRQFCRVRMKVGPSTCSALTFVRPIASPAPVVPEAARMRSIFVNVIPFEIFGSGVFFSQLTWPDNGIDTDRAGGRHSHEYILDSWNFDCDQDDVANASQDFNYEESASGRFRFLSSLSKAATQHDTYER